jgi:hypothetical protein
MSVQPHITGSIGAPRAVYIRYPAGNQLGEAGKPKQQRAIITAVLEAAGQIDTPGTVLEAPYRWRRFEISEEAHFPKESSGPTHPPLDALAESLDEVVSRAQAYKTYLEGRIAGDTRNADSPDSLAKIFAVQLERIDSFLEGLDPAGFDRVRDMRNSIATTELRVMGKFV